MPVSTASQTFTTTAGNDVWTGGRGNDVAVYNASLNTGSHDRLDGGAGNDTLVLQLTRSQWLNLALQSDIAALLRGIGTSCGGSGSYQFRTFDLNVRNFEAVRVLVDGTPVLDGTGKFTTASIAATPRNQCCFGAMASATKGQSVWEWVRYGSAKPVREEPKAPRIEGWQVTVRETVPIVPDAIYRSLFQYRDGRLVVGGKVSTDKGLTWMDGTGPGTAGFEFPDGEVISPGFSTKKVEEGVFSMPLSRSTDGGKSFVGEQATITMADATGGTGDDGKPYEGPSFDHSIVQLSDGSLLAAIDRTVTAPGARLLERMPERIFALGFNAVLTLLALRLLWSALARHALDRGYDFLVGSASIGLGQGGGSAAAVRGI